MQSQCSSACHTQARMLRGAVQNMTSYSECLNLTNTNISVDRFQQTMTMRHRCVESVPIINNYAGTSLDPWI